MKVPDLSTIFEQVSNEKIKELEKENRRLQEELRIKIQENNELKAKISSFESRKLSRLLNIYYRKVDESILFKIFAKIVYIIFFIPIQLLLLLGKDNNVSQVNYKSTIKEISEIISKSNAKKIVFFISPVKWDIPLFQRPQHIARHMAKEGVLYFYVVKWEKQQPIKKLYPNLYEVSAINLDLSFIPDVINIFRSKNFYVSTYSTDIEDISDTLRESRRVGGKILYEYVDEIDEKITGGSIPNYVMSRFEEVVKDEESTYVITTASKLFEDVSFYRKKKFALITNGVDYSHFHQRFNKNDLPIQLLKIFKKGKPLIGYYGALASWMDYDLIKYMAKKRPDYNFLFIGVDYDGSVIDSNIKDEKNVFVLPPVDYKDLPRYAYFLDVCMIPFQINEITLSTSPIKLFEYMALNKPIVTTAMPECKKYESVLVSDTYQDFIKNLDKALLLKSDKSYINLLDKEAKENTWESKAKEIIKLIDSE